MNKLQFRVLYREFLFRMVDLELLSSHAQGDMSRLFGQFASLLLFLSILMSIPSLGFGGSRPAMEQFLLALTCEHFLIATTMLVVGLFAVLSWDSTFPDKRDVLVLAPLPIRARTMFLAKVTGVAASLGLTVLVLHAVTGLLWPLAVNTRGIGGLPRMFAVYWGTMLASGAFIFGCVLGVQGLAAQLLPRRLFLRISSWMQLAAFCVFVSVYFLQPAATPFTIAAAQNRTLLAWSPSYWFLGMFQQLNGLPALDPLAWRAWIGLAVAILGTAVAYGLSYFRTLRKIVEEPDIAPGLRRGGWLPRFGRALPTAIVHFSVRSLLRSRQHRIILAFHLGIAFALTIFFLRSPAAQRQLSEAAASAPVLAANIVILGFWIVGTRVVFSRPLDLAANWIFRVTPVGCGPECAVARRRALLLLSATPVWAGSAVLFLWIWPWRLAAGHVLVLVLLGAILVEACLHGPQKIPFACSYLPGQSNFHMTFWLCIGLLFHVVRKAAEFEQRALERPVEYCWMLAALFAALAVFRWRTAGSADGDLRFEETPSWEVIELGLRRSL